MSNAVIPRQQGDAYQASFFWMKASELYLPWTGVHKVEWEADNSAGFDDVVVHYNPPLLEGGDDIIVEKFQVKFHVDHQRGFTCDALIDPDFIGTKSETILSRLHDIYKSDPSLSRRARFHIINTWGLDRNDDLKRLVGNNGAIILSRLFDGSTERSKHGKIRQMWKDHLSISSDDDLKEILRPLRIQHSFADLTNIVKPLNYSLYNAGLKPIDANRRTSGYVELIQKLHSEGKKSFTKDELFEICKREGLVIEKDEVKEESHVVGVRSFKRGAENLELEVDDFQCFLHLFAGRFIIENTSWQHIIPLLQDLSSRALLTKKHVSVHLDTHLSIAFYFGYCMDVKFGADVSIVQKTMNGKISWRPNPATLKDTKSEVWHMDELRVNESGTDLALALSVTHDIGKDVEQYIARELPHASRILHASIKPKPSNTSVEDANHIIKAIQELISYVRLTRRPTEKGGQLHLFIAAPNAFAFFLGQQSKVLGRLTLYEFDFENMLSGSYHPAISLPVNELK